MIRIGSSHQIDILISLKTKNPSINSSVSDNKKQNFGLSSTDFNELVAELKKDNNVLFEKIFLHHFKDCISYIQREYSAVYDDAYDATMDTMIEFRSRLLDNKIYYGNLRYLYTKMATQNYRRRVKLYQSREIEEDDIQEIDHPIDEHDVTLLSQAWEELGEECQSLLKLNFYCNMKLSEIAEKNKKSSPAIRKQKQRCLSRLMELFSKQSNII